MLVKLPRQCFGQEVVEAFKAASTFDETSEKRWEYREFIGNFQYEPGSVRQTIRSMGVYTWPLSLRKKWGLFGKRVWKPDYTPKFTLVPLVLAGRYSEVEVAVEYVYDVGQGGEEWVATNPHHPKFADIQPQFEKILANFFARLSLS